MLSLRSLAFILASARRRARALSCAALHCFPDIIIGRKMATNIGRKTATKRAAPMCSLLRTVYPPKAITARGAKDPFGDTGSSPGSCNTLIVEVRPPEERPDKSATRTRCRNSQLSGAMPIRSFTAARMRCLQPR